MPTNAYARRPRVVWTAWHNGEGIVQTDAAILQVLLDLRDVLDRIAGRLDCPETHAIPRLLRRIELHTRRKPRLIKTRKVA